MDTPADFVPDAEFKPDAVAEGSHGASPDFVPDDKFTPDEHYETPIEKVKTAIEGAGRGMLGPFSDAAAIGLRKFGENVGIDPDIMAPKPEEMAARQRINPLISHGSEAAAMTAGFLTGTGVPGAISKVGELAAVGEEASVLAKIGSSALKGAIETGLIQGGSELSNAMLGNADPETPVASALVNMGAAGLLGGAFGGVFGAGAQGLKKLAESRVGVKATQFLEDFGNRWKFHQEHPDLVTSVHEELKPFFEENRLLRKEVYAPGGAKDKALLATLPKEVNDQILQHAIDISESAKQITERMVKDGVPRGARNEFQQTMARYVEATNDAKSPYDFFKAADTLKKEIGEYVPWSQLKGGQLQRTDPNYSFIKNAAKMYDGIATSLENPKVWGEAGAFQKDLNEAITKFMPADKDFGTFTQKIQGQRTIDPTKIKSYVRQAGKSGVDIADEIRPQKMKNYIESAEKFRDEITGSYTSRGLQSPLKAHSLNAVKGSYGASQSAGAEAADHMFHSAVPDFAAKVGGIGVGAGIGYHEGGVKGAIAGGIGGIIAPKLAGFVGQKINRIGVPVALKVLSSGNAAGLAKALDYANHVESGAQKINKSIDYLFRSGSQQLFTDLKQEANREKLRKHIEEGTLDSQIQQDAAKTLSAPSPAPGPQGFAEGGEVKQPFGAVAQPPPRPLAVDENNAVAEHFPTQNIMINTAKGRISNYLNSLRPQPPMGKLPFDRPAPKDKTKESSYNKALDLANSPLSIIGSIKKGTITPEQTKHFVQLYPELHSHLSKKITERVTNQQLNDERPSYKVRQALSLFLGAPLDSSMTPQATAAAQSVFAQKKAAQQGGGANQTKKGTAPLSKMAGNYKTSGQALETRQQKDH